MCQKMRNTMKGLLFCAGALLLLGWPDRMHSRDVIGMYDLGYTLQTDLATAEGRNTAWDDVHLVAALQGIVNRDAARLYVYFVERDGVGIDRYWFDKYRRRGQWLYGKETVTYGTIEELVEAYADYVEGVVLYDGNVPSTSNVASSVAGSDDLLPVRYDPSPGSLYDRLVAHGPCLPVKCRLVNEDGSPMFTGKGTIPGTSRASTGSVKNDPYIWYIENYMKQGRCNTEYAGYYIDQYWKQNPAAANRNHHTLSNHDFFISKRGFFFDLSPWGDEPATDEPGQPAGTDLATLKEMLLLAYRQNEGERFCYIGGFPAWAYKYTMHAGGIHDDVPTEWEFSRLISAYNAFKDADAIGYGAMANASFWQHYPTAERYPQRWVDDEDLRRRGYIDEAGGGVTDDHLYINRYGIPTIDIIHQEPQSPTGFFPYWHTRADNMEHIDKTVLEAVGRTVMTVVYEEKIQ